MIRGLAKQVRHQLVVLYRGLLPLLNPRHLVSVPRLFLYNFEDTYEYALVFAPFP